MSKNLISKIYSKYLNRKEKGFPLDVCRMKNCNIGIFRTEKLKILQYLPTCSDTLPNWHDKKIPKYKQSNMEVVECKKAKPEFPKL
jgi:hypothetical protein